MKLFLFFLMALSWSPLGMFTDVLPCMAELISKKGKMFLCEASSRWKREHL